MKHEWMRQDKVDILKYLPAFLAKDPRFKATNDADSLEHDAIRIDLQDVIDQLYVESATWGIEKWEELVGIDADDSSSIESRREAVLAKLRKPESVTEIFLTNLINRFISDKEGEILSYPEEYRIEILYHGGTILDYSKLREAVRTYIPAHIGYKLVTITRGELQYHGAGIVQIYSKDTVDMVSTSHQEVKDTPQYYAGFVAHNYKLTQISGGVLTNG